MQISTSLPWLLGLIACGESALSPDATHRDASPHDGRSNGCNLSAPAATDPVFAVLAHPFTAAGDSSGTDYEVFELTTNDFVVTGQHFNMKRANVGDIVFRSDGRVGFSPQSDGTLGVFGFENGVATVKNVGWDAGIYASRIIAMPDGELFVLDGNFAENGGGVYRIVTTCDGEATGVEKLFATKLATHLFIRGNRAWVVAADAPGGLPGAEVHLLPWPATDATPALASIDAFGDDEALVGGAALSPDGETLLIGDNNSFSGLPNRVSVVRRSSDALTRTDVLTPLEDPGAIVWAPDGARAVVASGFGNALVHLPGGTTIGGNIATSNAVELPTSLAVVPRGPHAGRAVSVEVLRLRLLDLVGAPDDVLVTTLPDSSANITGAFGFAP